MLRITLNKKPFFFYHIFITYFGLELDFYILTQFKFFEFICNAIMQLFLEIISKSFLTVCFYFQTNFQNSYKPCLSDCYTFKSIKNTNNQNMPTPKNQNKSFLFRHIQTATTLLLLFLLLLQNI